MVFVVISAVFWFIVALVLAALEIEIEGKFGWAEKLPTWYRKTGFVKIFGKNARPFSGYNLFFTIMLLLFFHSGFFLGLKWTISAELILLSVYVLLCSLWDFLWFVLNPHYTIINYKKNKVWWFSKSKWVFGKFPLDYIHSLIAALALTLIASFISKNFGFLMNIVYTVLMFILLTIITIVLAPFYHKWYKKMRKKDDRKLAGIFH